MPNKLYSLGGEKLYGLGLISVVTSVVGLAMGIMFMVDGSQKDTFHKLKGVLEKVQEEVNQPETPIQG